MSHLRQISPCVNPRRHLLIQWAVHICFLLKRSSSECWMICIYQNTTNWNVLYSLIAARDVNFFTKRLFVIKDLFNAHTLNEAQNNATEFYMYQQTAVLILNAFFSDYTSMCARPFSSEQFPHLCSAHLVSVSILLPRLRQFGVVLWYNVMFTTRNKKSISTISRLTGQRFGNKNCLVISAIDWAAVTSKCENLAKLFFAFSPVIISLYPL